MIRGFKILVLLAFAVVACSENPVGNECIIPGISDIVPTDAGVGDRSDSEKKVSAPALDCSSRTCLYSPTEPGAGTNGSRNTPLCTATCESDDDCDKVENSPCNGGFTCTIAVGIGNFCCQKFCVCSDYVVIPEGGSRAIPGECDPDNASNTCCNLPGRGSCGGI